MKEVNQEAVEQKARQLKEYVGLAMSLDECRNFVRSVLESCVENEKPKQPKWLSEALNSGDGVYRP